MSSVLAFFGRHTLNKHNPLIELLYSEPGRIVLRFIGVLVRPGLTCLSCATRFCDDIGIFLLRDSSQVTALDVPGKGSDSTGA